MLKVSIIIPVYNVEEYLTECLNSVINQTLKDIEIICINDGSYDNSFPILEKYAKKDERIKIFSQEHKGVSVARNKGLEVSNGRFVTFLDSDDMLELNCLEMAYNSIIAKKTDIVCFGINKIESGIKSPRWDSKYLSEQPSLSNISFFLQNVAGKLFDNSFIKKHNILFPENIKTCEDGLFCLLCLYKNATFSYLNKNLYNYLIGRTGSACTLKNSIVETDIEAFKYILNTNEFKIAKTEFKIITIEKFFKHFRWNDVPKYRLKNYIKINKFIKYLYKNVDKNILKECQLKDIPRYCFINLVRICLFDIEKSPDKKHVLLVFLGLRLNFKLSPKKILML